MKKPWPPGCRPLMCAQSGGEMNIQLFVLSSSADWFQVCRQQQVCSGQKTRPAAGTVAPDQKKTV